MSQTGATHQPMFPRIPDCCYYSIHKITGFTLDTSGRAAPGTGRVWDQEMAMADGFSPKPPRRARGRPFEKGRSGHPAGRRTGSRNKATIAAALLEGESEALTRKAVELALTGDPTALRLCIERILPPCRERPVRFTLLPIESSEDISAAMNAVTAALARGIITPGEAERIANVVDTFAQAIATTKRRESAVDPLQILGLANYDET